MNDEEKAKLQEEAKEADKPKDIVMTIIRSPDGKMGISFPLMGDKVIAYGFLKLGEKVLDAYYAKAENKTPLKGGIMNFARKMN